MASPTTDYRGSKPTDSPKKKKKKPIQKIRNQTHDHVAGRENQTPIQSIQRKSKTNSNKEVFIKKKKKKTPI